MIIICDPDQFSGELKITEMDPVSKNVSGMSSRLFWYIFHLNTFWCDLIFCILDPFSVKIFRLTKIWLKSLGKWSFGFHTNSGNPPSSSRHFFWHGMLLYPTLVISLLNLAKSYKNSRLNLSLVHFKSVFFFFHFSREMHVLTKIMAFSNDYHFIRCIIYSFSFHSLNIHLWMSRRFNMSNITSEAFCCVFCESSDSECSPSSLSSNGVFWFEK